MMKIGRALLAAVAIFTLGACANDGRPGFISDAGVSKEVNNAQGLAPNGDGLLFQFKLAAESARPFTFEPTAKLVDNDPAKQRTFMDAGFALIQARCNSYILSKADNQRQVNVWRDTFAPITALLTGGIALMGNGDDTNNDVLTALSLGTSAASAGFRIYEQRYLFGAENVNSVRLLVLKALADNALEASKTTDQKLNYSQSVTHLINNQAVCSPGHILQLVTEAIQAGKVVSTKSDGGPSVPQKTQAEGELEEMKTLLEQLKKDKALTDQEIGTAKVAVAAARAAAPRPAGVPASEGLEVVTTKILNTQ